MGEWTADNIMKDDKRRQSRCLKIEVMCCYFNEYIYRVSHMESPQKKMDTVALFLVFDIFPLLIYGAGNYVHFDFCKKKKF